MSCKPERVSIHPERRGVHVVSKRLRDGTIRRYVYKHRGGPQIAVVDEGEDAEKAIRDHIGIKRRDVVRF